MRQKNLFSCCCPSEKDPDSFEIPEINAVLTKNAKHSYKSVSQTEEESEEESDDSKVIFKG